MEATPKTPSQKPDGTLVFERKRMFAAVEKVAGHDQHWLDR
jgi:hypothetical protein